MIKAVFIDVDNTLLDFGESSKIAITKTAKQFGIELDDSFFGVFKVINDYLWRQIEDKKITKDELWNMRFNMVFSECGIDFSNGALFDTKYRENLFNTAVPVDNAIDVLRYLKSKYKICVTSNSIRHDQQVNRLEIAGMMQYIDKVFTMENIGYAKPDTRFFDACLISLGNIEKDEILLIGDSLSADIMGGINFGIKTCWFNFENEPEPKDIHPDFIITSLTEIKEIL